jgi:hypothetical protein
MSEAQGESARIEVSAPCRFGSTALLMCSAYGLALLLPTLFAMIAVSLMGLGLLTLALPLMTLAAATFFLPFGFGNPYLKKLAEPFKPKQGEPMLVQLSFEPRLRSGLRATIEDADDVGWLTCTASGFFFDGDSVKLFVPAARINAVKHQNSGFRGLFLYSGVAVEVAGIPSCRRLKFAERSSLMLWHSRGLTRQLYSNVKRASVRPGSPVPA